jgi:hypothetical protein
MSELTKSVERKKSIAKMSAVVGQSPSVGAEQSPIFNSDGSQDLRKSYGTNWTPANVSTLFEWISIAAYNIQCLDQATDYHRKKIRMNTIFGLVLSTLSGTLATSQATLPASVTGTVTTVVNVAFIIMSFTIALMTGYIKVYQIQENLESNLKNRHDWTTFITAISSELQLPVELRRDALWLIIKNKNEYLELLKVDLDIPPFITEKVKKEFEANPKLKEVTGGDVSSLSHILIEIAYKVKNNINAIADEKSVETPVQPSLESNSWKKKLQPKKSLESIEENTLFFDEKTTGSVKDEHQVVSINMNDSFTHPHLGVRQDE